MSVLQRKDLEDSPLADLHAISSELGIEGYRALRREDLVKAILEAQGGEEPAGDAAEAPEADADERGDEPDPGERADPELDDEPRRRGRRSRRNADPERDAAPEADSEPEPEPEPDEPREPVAGVLDILPNGSGFLRVGGEGQTSDDVYVSPAQIRRCELRAGDTVEGPLRPARRSERHPSLVRVETVNGHEAEPPEQRPDFGDLTPVHPVDRLPSPKALKDVPYGKGSRVAISGAPGAGLTWVLASTVDEIVANASEVTVSVVLVGARPEEVTGWKAAGNFEVTGGSFDRSIEAQTQAAELAIERGKRIAERGGDAVIAIDSLEALPPGPARRLFGAARNLEEGGSLTIIAVVGSAHEPLRQASTAITLDAAASEPTILAARSRTQRPDLLR